MEQHDRSPQTLGIALCRGNIRIPNLHCMFKPTIGIDRQPRDIHHALARTGQMLADEVLLMNRL